jgi:hypothetical protein
MRVPAALVARYGRKFVRISLKTSDPREAIRRAEPLVNKYQAEFSSLRNNANLTSPALAGSALDTAKARGDFSLFIEHVIDPKRDKYEDTIERPRVSSRRAVASSDEKGAGAASYKRCPLPGNCWPISQT